MPIFRFLLKSILIICFTFTGLHSQPEESILFSTKGKIPIYAKVKLDTNGNRKSISYIQVNEDSENLVQMEGLSISKIKYDKKTQTLKIKEYNIDKKLLFTNKVKILKDGYELITFLGKKKDGKAIFKKIIYDLKGNKTQEEYLDENKKPNTNKQKIYKIVYKYNKQGKRISIETFDSKGKSKGDKYGIAKYLYAYDARGNRLTIEYFGENGKPKENKEGIAKESFTYDYTNFERGKLILRETFDKNDKPKADSKGIGNIIYKYDKKGNKTLTEFRDEKGKLVEDGKGFARYVFAYSDSGNVTLEEEYGKDGKLKLDPADGIARSVTKIETKGDTTIKTTKFFDTDGSLKTNEVLEVAIVKTTTILSKEGKEVKTEYFDTIRKPKFSGEGYAVMLQKYDQLGNEILEEYFDGNGKPILCRDGYSKYTATFKDKEMLSEEYYTMNGKLIEGDDGFAKQVRTFNESNKLISIENFNSENKYIESNLGYAKIIISYNQDGNKTEEIYLNAKLKPANNSEGISKIHYQYDKSCLANTKKEEDCYSIVQYFDQDEKPKANKKQFAKLISTYDEKGRLLSVQTFHEDDTKHSKHVYTYRFGSRKEIAWEMYKNNAISKAVYSIYLNNPNSDSKPIIRITLNRLNRPLSLKLGK